MANKSREFWSKLGLEAFFPPKKREIFKIEPRIRKKIVCPKIDSKIQILFKKMDSEKKERVFYRRSKWFLEIFFEICIL